MKTRSLLIYVLAFLFSAIYSQEVIFNKKEQKSIPIEKLPIDSGTVTDIDGNTYKTVKIGTQWWVAENLAVTQYANGTPVPPVTGDADWAALDDDNTDKAYCWYNDDIANKDIYGALYTYAAATNGKPFDGTNPVQGICPNGWHLPNETEWAILENYLADNNLNHGDTCLGGRDKIDKAMASKTGWNSFSEDGTIGNHSEDNNTSNFSALPGGYRYFANGSFLNVGENGYWWSSSEDKISHYIFIRFLSYNKASLGQVLFRKSSGLSVRCIKE
ncbi:FISUMP domain-containing protein [Saccharicrinis sp. FJH2]|uniref:FISUMP domain-containing protein n=1 Tax=Saccharicrinis sp. FJH65 TaxID=3344659 RepID=UPI0035F24923